MPGMLVLLIAAILAATPIVGSLPVSQEDVHPVPTTAQPPTGVMATNPSLNAAMQSTEASSTCLLSNDQVRDIQSHQSDLIYMVVNGQVFVKEHPLDLYIELFRVVSQTAGTIQQVQEVWLSRAPCKACIVILQHIFYGSWKPTLHIETWRTERVQQSYPAVLQGMGCISALKREQYTVKAWDWEEFAEEIGTTCAQYNVKPNTSHAEETDYLQRSLQYISGFDEFCS